jgi:hypothetical protein
VVGRAGHVREALHLDHVPVEPIQRFGKLAQLGLPVRRDGGLHHDDDAIAVSVSDCARRAEPLSIYATC